MSRLLEYLDLDYPVEGRVSGSFPVVGNAAALSGGGPVTVRDAVIWGQRVPLVTGKLLFSPGTFQLDDVRAEIDGGVVAGSGSIALERKTFEARFAADGIPIGAVTALADVSEDVSGKLSFQVAGDGEIARPNLTATATLTDASLFGHELPEGSEPRLDVKMVRGALTGGISVPERWTLSAEGNLLEPGAKVNVSLDARDLAALLLFTPFTLEPGRGGALALRGVLTLPADEKDVSLRRVHGDRGAARLSGSSRHPPNVGRRADRAARAEAHLRRVPRDRGGHRPEGERLGGPRSRARPLPRRRRPDRRVARGRSPFPARCSRAASSSTFPPAGPSRRPTSRERFASRTGSTG